MWAAGTRECGGVVGTGGESVSHCSWARGYVRPSPGSARRVGEKQELRMGFDHLDQRSVKLFGQGPGDERTF